MMVYDDDGNYSRFSRINKSVLPDRYSACVMKSDSIIERKTYKEAVL